MTNEEMAPQEQEQPKIGTVGGEALMEGIMMRGPKGRAAIALRLPNGRIETKLKQVKLPAERCKVLGWPLIRGPVNLVSSMAFGYKCLMESAEKVTEGLMEEAAEEGEELGRIDQWLERHPKVMKGFTVIGSVLGVILAIALFSTLPSLTHDGIAWLVAHFGGEVDISAWRAVIEGVVRITLFVLCMFLMSQLKDIRRVFQYHGAEHKAIYCYESGLELTVENVKAQSRLHPRCGTSFLFVVLMLSIAVSVLLSLAIPELWAHSNLIIRTGVRLMVLPLLMALGYEFIRFAGKHLKNPLVRALSFPGVSMQRITTKEPDEKIIEVGIVALKAALGMPYEEEEEPDDDDTPGDAACPEEPVAE